MRRIPKISGLEKYLLSVGIFASVLSYSASASATNIDLGTIDTAETVSGSASYTAGEVLTFTFVIDAPYTFDFTETGSGGDFPFPISQKNSGSDGSQSFTYGAFPLNGTVTYSLSTSAAPAVPEPATWVMMIAGVGGVGGVMRRKRRQELSAEATLA